jgi:hypothetical protein
VDNFDRANPYADEVTTTLGGTNYGHGYWDRPKQQYQLAFALDSQDANLALLQDILQRLLGRIGIVWVPEPTSRLHRDVHLGDGDGTRKTFVAPWLDAAAAPTVTVANVPTTVAWEARANLLDDEDALPTSVTGWSAVVGGTVALDATYAMLGAYAAKMDPGGVLTGYGARLPKVTGITVGRYYTGLAFCRSTLAALKARITWYTAGDGVISQSAGAAITLGSGWTCVYVRAAAPATAAKAALDVFFDGEDNEVFWMGCASLGALEDYWWFLPSACPGVTIHSVAPAAGQEILASYTGRLILPCHRTRQESQRVDGAGNLTLPLDVEEWWGELD